MINTNNNDATSLIVCTAQKEQSLSGTLTNRSCGLICQSLLLSELIYISFQYSRDRGRSFDLTCSIGKMRQIISPGNCFFLSFFHTVLEKNQKKNVINAHHAANMSHHIKRQQLSYRFDSRGIILNNRRFRERRSIIMINRQFHVLFLFSFSLLLLTRNRLNITR